MAPKRGGKIIAKSQPVKRGYKRWLLITFFVIAVFFTILDFLTVGIKSYNVSIVVSLIELIFSALTFAWSIIAIKNKDKAIGIVFLVISAIILLLWISGFIINLTNASKTGSVIFG